MQVTPLQMVKVFQNCKKTVDILKQNSLMSSLCLFQILLYRNHSRKNSDNNSVISTMFRI